MKRLIACLLFLVAPEVHAQAEGKPPYPIIFAHGLVGSDKSFNETMSYLRSDFHWGSNTGKIYVYDVILNADNDIHSSTYTLDVSDRDTVVDGRSVFAGRRTYADDINGYQDGWSDSSARIFAINFQEERIRGASGGVFGDDLFDYSNESAIYKQGLALKMMISEVLEFTGCERVVLVGHSMGGLAIREYLQRTVDGTPNTNHVWWQNQSSTGHRVAKVVTIGTPHLGSNFGYAAAMSIMPPNLFSEATRDLRHTYFKNGSWSVPGTYLFGGIESGLDSLGFFNIDVNCDGDSVDEITGISVATIDNPSMPLPENLPYTWITSDLPLMNGDLIVDLDRQWLYDSLTLLPAPLGVSDTLMMSRVHWDEPSDIASVVRGLDEPANPTLAFSAPFNKSINGIISYQWFMLDSDVDYFKVAIPDTGVLSITIDGVNSGVTEIGFYDEQQNQILHQYINHFPHVLETNVLTGTYFIKLTGTASDETWRNPYSVFLNIRAMSLSADFEADLTTGEAPLQVHFIDRSISQNEIVSWQWDFENDGNIDSYVQNPTHTYDYAGLYSVRLVVSDGTNSVSVVKGAFIHVNQGGLDGPSLTYVEYFFDHDPGRGNGTAVAITPQPTMDLDIQVDVSGLEPGFHRVFFRALDAAGMWSGVHGRTFFKETIDQLSVVNIRRLEYFFDVDPGVGNGIAIPIAQSPLINKNHLIDLTGLSDGFHSFKVRALDAKGAWSMIRSRQFFMDKQFNPGGYSITQLEYQIDADVPQPVYIAPSAHIDQDFFIDLSAVATGFHQLSVWAYDQRGVRTFVKNRTFYKEPYSTESQSAIVELDWFIMNDSLTTELEHYADFVPDSNVTIDLNIDLYGLPLGNEYKLVLFGKNSHGLASLRAHHEFSIIHLNAIPRLDSIPDLQFFEDDSMNIPLNYYVMDRDHDSTQIQFSASVLTASSGLKPKRLSRRIAQKKGLRTISVDASELSIDPSDLSVQIDPVTHVASITTTADSSGSFTVVFSAVDDSGASDTDTILVTVVPQNDPPHAVRSFDDFALEEDCGLQLVTARIDTFFMDIDDPVLAFGVQADTGVSAYANGDSLFVLPNSDFFGLCSVIVEASDGQSTASDTFSINISNVNDAPGEVVLLLPTDSDTLDAVQTVFVWHKGIDVDMDTLRYALRILGDNQDTLLGFQLDTTMAFDGSMFFQSLETFSWYVLAWDGTTTTSSDTFSFVCPSLLDITCTCQDII